ncbi:MAG: hypothetical protein JNK64_20925 [Myxococcales bacterium]|nr:hypothetical protein [Myxococcales bacterium]
MRPSRTRARELHLLAFVRAYSTVRGIAPVYEEIADELRVSVPFIYKLICRLEDRGEVACLWASGHRSPRSIRVLTRREGTP